MAVEADEDAEVADPVAWRRARHLMLGMLCVELAVLGVTGAVLFFVYRPSAGLGLNEIDLLSRDAAWSLRLQIAHRVMAWLLLPTAVAAALAASLGPRPALTRTAGVVRVVAAAAIPALLLVTGARLAWDQLGLFAATPGLDIDGFVTLLGDDVRFVVVDGSRVSPNTLLLVLALHVALAVVAVGLPGWIWWSCRPPMDLRRH